MSKPAAWLLDGCNVSTRMVPSVYSSRAPRFATTAEVCNWANRARTSQASDPGTWTDQSVPTAGSGTWTVRRRMSHTCGAAPGGSRQPLMGRASVQLSEDRGNDRGGQGDLGHVDQDVALVVAVENRNLGRAVQERLPHEPLAGVVRLRGARPTDTEVAEIGAGEPDHATLGIAEVPQDGVIGVRLEAVGDPVDRESRGVVAGHSRRRQVDLHGQDVRDPGLESLPGLQPGADAGQVPVVHHQRDQVDLGGCAQ